MVDRFAHPILLGIETSCDDTACALLDGDGRVLASVVASQLARHRPYGGVVPEIASREHLKNWPTVLDEAMSQAGLTLEEVDLVAATRGPGLVGSLLVGLATGKAIAWSLDRPFFGVHHIEGHLYSPFLDPEGAAAHSIPDRFVGLVVSGGHTSLFEVDQRRVRTVAETRDDAIGEVFDKVGKRLGLPYPQGPVVDRIAETYEGPAAATPLPIPRVDRDLFFSYSGLKSAAIRQLEVLERSGHQDNPTLPADPEALDRPRRALLSEFRRAAVAQIIHRLARYHGRHPIHTLAVSGGVAANRLLRRELTRWSEEHEVKLHLVPLTFSGDNAAMIAFAAWLRYREDPKGDDLSLEAVGRVSIEETAGAGLGASANPTGSAGQRP